MELAMARFGLPDPRTTAAKSANFTVYQPPSRDRSLSELIAHRRAESERAIEYEDATNLFRVDLKADGPIGLMIFGDPHIDSPGCDFRMLESHLSLAAKRAEYVFAGNIGDLQDNWIGRLERLYADSTTNSRETWRLVEWMMKGCGVQWTWLIKGNHDCWLGRNDPLDWISKSAGVGIEQPHGVRIGFQHPNGQQTRMNARHDFKGNSIYNPLHSLKREVLHGHRDHIVVAGHRHIGADARDINGDGMPFVMVRVSGYKVADPYRLEIGAHAKPLHPSALIVVDPDEPESSNNRVWCAPTCEEGIDYLTFKRKRFNSRPRAVNKKPIRRK
jgi:hypothetical protein